MNNEKETTNENQEQEKQAETVIENSGSVLEKQKIKVDSDTEAVKDMGERDVGKIEEAGVYWKRLEKWEMLSKKQQKKRKTQKRSIMKN